MPVEGATQGATNRVAGNGVLLFIQREDPDGQVGDDPIYVAVRGDEHGRVMTYDNPDPVNVSLFLSQVLDDDPTEVNSFDNGVQIGQDIDCSTYRRFALERTVVSAGSPTTIEFFVEFSNDGGTTWAHYKQGLFASLVDSDASVTTQIHEIQTGDVAGDLFRLRVVGVGTTAPNNFTFTALVRFWR